MLIYTSQSFLKKKFFLPPSNGGGRLPSNGKKIFFSNMVIYTSRSFSKIFFPSNGGVGCLATGKKFFLSFLFARPRLFLFTAYYWKAPRAVQKLPSYSDILLESTVQNSVLLHMLLVGGCLAREIFFPKRFC